MTVNDDLATTPTSATALGVRHAAFIGVASMVGAGIFSLLGAAGEVELTVVVDVAQLDRGHRPVGAASDELEVEDADQPAVDQIDQRGQPFPGHLVAGELEDEVADRPHRVCVVCHRSSLSTLTGPVRGPRVTTTIRPPGRPAITLIG